MSNTLRIHTVLTLTALGLLILAAASSAQTPIDERRSVAADVEITIENVSGDVTVSAWDRSEVHVTGTLGKGAEEFVMEGDEQRLEIRVELPEHARNVKKSPLEIRVPVGAELEISVISGDVGVDGVRGVIVIETISGDIEAEGRCEEIEASTASGDITLLVETDHAEATAISGDIELRGVRGDVEAETVSGDIHVIGSVFKRFKASSVSGDLYFEGDLEGDGVYRFECHSGDITLVLPESVDADFDISTFNGDISNAFGPQAHRTSKYAPGSELDFRQGNGSASVRAETFSGDIDLETR